MPKGFVLVEDGSISFKASQDLYNKFVGFFLCVVFHVEDGENEVSFDIVPRVNGQRRNELSGTLGSFDTDHVCLNIRVAGATVKKLGYVLQSNPLEDALKVEIEKNCLMDLASLFEDRENPQYYVDSGWKYWRKRLEDTHGGRETCRDHLFRGVNHLGFG
ncbi:hypothetical protein EUGRSUZ_H01838 [Eucalyptus grandis]|uniref:Uncharacterized protein n=2 Tax=Eucalyptus grandis TaxID=71139 RepID=A0ACC3JQK6_EUCGR|nr:hypothetical protein EUGRSUZ_H01838 [Eucalyptus grandis]